MVIHVESEMPNRWVTGRGAPVTSGLRIRSETAPRWALTRRNASKAKATMKHTATHEGRHRPFGRSPSGAVRVVERGSADHRRTPRSDGLSARGRAESAAAARARVVGAGRLSEADLPEHLKGPARPSWRRAPFVAACYPVIGGPHPPCAPPVGAHQPRPVVCIATAVIVIPAATSLPHGPLLAPRHVALIPPKCACLELDRSRWAAGDDVDSIDDVISLRFEHVHYRART